mgnify:CR=1 FL=1
MTKDDIKKALATCVGASCDGCAYHDDLTCIDTLKTDARKCIIKQEKEIERLKAEFKQLETNAEILARGVRDLNDENYKLTEKIKQAHEQSVKDIKQLKTECALLDDELRIAMQNTIDVLNELKERIPLAMSKQYVCAQIDKMIKELVQNAEDKS